MGAVSAKSGLETVDRLARLCADRTTPPFTSLGTIAAVRGWRGAEVQEECLVRADSTHDLQLGELPCFRLHAGLSPKCKRMWGATRTPPHP